MGSQTIVVKRNIPIVTSYNDVTPPESFTYVDAGLYNENSIPADAGLYNTSSWDIVWVGGFT